METVAFEALNKHAEQGNWLAFGVIATIVLVVKLPSIIAFFEKRKLGRQEAIKEMLKLPFLSQITRQALEDELICIGFKNGTGLNSSPEFREAALKTIKESKGELQLFQLVKAKRYLSLKELTLHVDISGMHRLEHAFNWVCTTYITFFGLYVFAIPAINPGMGPVQIITLVTISLACISLATFIAWQAIPYSIAKRIKPIIEKAQQR